MKKKIILAIVVIILAGGYFYLNPLLPIITGYAAKNLASGVFVAGRTQESMEKEDLNFSFIKYTKNKIDFEKKEVVSRFLWGKSKAIYNEGFGCALVHDYSMDEMKSRPYSVVESLPLNPDTIPWPMGDLIADSLPAGVDTIALNDALVQAFLDTIPFKGTFAVMVVYKGQPIVERYRADFNAQNKFLSWSMAKSVTNSLVGILVRDGKVDIHQPLGLPEWQNDGRSSITLNHLMHMNSGLEWNENYGNSSNVNVMLHKKGDMGGYSSKMNLTVMPDSVWVYSSGTTNIVSKYIRSLINDDKTYYEFPRRELFNKIGMRSAIWEVDASGTFVGSSYIYATLRDYARYGLLYLNNGNWLGEQILPKGWIEYTTTEANGSEGQYGAFFWLNKSGTDYPDVPRDMYCCRGHDGQYIYIIPSKQLVVVRTGFSKKGTFDLNAFLGGIVKSVN
jgi:CubicO group peptidase (beta-lactamase class C family)